MSPPENRVAVYVQKTTDQSGFDSVMTFEAVITEVGGIWNSEDNNFIIPTRGTQNDDIVIMTVSQILNSKEISLCYTC